MHQKILSLRYLFGVRWKNGGISVCIPRTCVWNSEILEHAIENMMTGYIVQILQIKPSPKYFKSFLLGTAFHFSCIKRVHLCYVHFLNFWWWSDHNFFLFFLSAFDKWNFFAYLGNSVAHLKKCSVFFHE